MSSVDNARTLDPELEPLSVPVHETGHDLSLVPPAPTGWSRPPAQRQNRGDAEQLANVHKRIVIFADGT